MQSQSQVPEFGRDLATAHGGHRDAVAFAGAARHFAAIAELKSRP
jgi:hypothetical protein